MSSKRVCLTPGLAPDQGNVLRRLMDGPCLLCGSPFSPGVVFAVVDGAEMRCKSVTDLECCRDRDSLFASIFACVCSVLGMLSSSIVFPRALVAGGGVTRRLRKERPWRWRNLRFYRLLNQYSITYQLQRSLKLTDASSHGRCLLPARISFWLET